MDETKQEAIKETVDSTSEDTQVDSSTEQDPLEAELEKVQSKSEGRTELEKAIFKRNQIDNRIKELKGDDEPEETDDDAPVTVGMLKKLQQEAAVKTALQLADEIPNKIESQLVKYHIENSIRSTGNPTEDLRLARAIVNSTKNSQIAEEMGRKTTAKTHSSSSGAPAKHQVEQELTAEETLYMKQFHLTKEEVLKARS